MADEFDEVFAGLSTNAHLGSFELLQRVKRRFLETNPGEIEYTAACGLIEAFYEANNWKPPAPIAPAGYATDLKDTIARARASSQLQFEAYQNQIMANYRAVMKTKAAEALQRNFDCSELAA